MAIYDKLVNIKGGRYGVFSEDYYISHMNVLKDDDHCAVEINRNGKNYILPILTTMNSTDNPGIYSGDGKVSFINYPSIEDEKAYMPEGDDVLVFDDCISLQAINDAKKKLDESINKLIETTDGSSIYKPPLLESDSAEMRAMKECIIAKNIDLDKYKDRFGANYPNDKRKLKDDNITLNMISRMCENLDIRLDLVFSDANGEIPNPMDKIVKANIIPGDGSCIIISKDNDNDEEFEEDED